jgi:pyruvate dehydrogenase E1 component alpha subunit
MPRFSDKLTITLPESSFEMYNAEKPSLDIEITKEELLDMYNKMTTMRRMEMVADGLYKAKKIRGFCHLCNGQVKIQPFYYYCFFFFFFWLGMNKLGL